MSIVAGALWLTIDRDGEGLASGLFVGSWTLRNHVRNTMFARKAITTVILSDLGYSATGIVLVTGLLWLQSGVPQATAVLMLLAAANAVGIGAAFAILGRPIRVSFRRGVRRHYHAAWNDIARSPVNAHCRRDRNT